MSFAFGGVFACFFSHFHQLMITDSGFVLRFHNDPTAKDFVISGIGTGGNDGCGQQNNHYGDFSQDDSS